MFVCRLFLFMLCGAMSVFGISPCAAQTGDCASGFSASCTYIPMGMDAGSSSSSSTSAMPPGSSSSSSTSTSMLNASNSSTSSSYLSIANTSDSAPMPDQSIPDCGEVPASEGMQYFQKAGSLFKVNTGLSEVKGTWTKTSSGGVWTYGISKSSDTDSPVVPAAETNAKAPVSDGIPSEFVGNDSSLFTLNE